MKDHKFVIKFSTGTAMGVGDDKASAWDVFDAFTVNAIRSRRRGEERPEHDLYEAGVMVGSYIHSPVPRQCRERI